MLARPWGPQEATSIWVELVSERKKEVAASLDSAAGLPYSSYAAAAQPEILRSQLAEWDASARSWLQYADRVKYRQQKQLLLIIDNLGLQVNTKNQTYSSVIETWILALQTLEKLASGQPQAVCDGAALLGVSTWHLYPDLIVTIGKGKETQMNDSLIPRGGILTVGLEPGGSRDDGNKRGGLYWSLSLAHLRFYGRPVQKESEVRLHSGASKVTFQQFLQAVLGATLGSWQNTQSRNADILKFLSWLHQKNPMSMPEWLKLISWAASEYSHFEGQEHEDAVRLIKLGLRRWHKFLGLRKSTIDPFFWNRDPYRYRNNHRKD